MLNTQTTGAVVVGLILLAAPVSFLVAALAPAALRQRYPIARRASALVVLAALFAGGARMLLGATVVKTSAAPSAWGLSLRLDSLTAVMLALIATIGFVIVDYSRGYLRGDPGQARHERWLLATLGAVSALVVSNNLVVLALAWTATSLALHQLLTFYRDRPQALIAAHKKFIVSRAADACVLGAVALVASTYGTAAMDEVFERAASAGQPRAIDAAMVLLAFAVVLKSAQLPFHGWLIQVMEAPTPVSALLHAGVVNIGGFVLIRLAPLGSRVETAQTILVAVGSITAVLASLIMTTRVSVKVNLAWSTCAQMGFMLVQCGLGAYELALLHLVAHSAYKAHAFLRAGSAVSTWRVQTFAPLQSAPSLGRWLAIAVGSLAVVVGSALALGINFEREPALVVFVPVVGMALARLIGEGLSFRARPLVASTLLALVVASSYFASHAAVGLVLESTGHGRDLVSAHRVVLALVLFVALFVASFALRAAPQSRAAHALHRALFAGLYLDELFTRLTFRLWPARLDSKQSAPSTRFQEVESHG